MKQILFAIFFASFIHAQQFYYSGKISDENGYPVSDCSFIIENVSSFFYTDFNGEYNIKLPFLNDSKVFINRIGFESILTNLNDLYSRKNFTLNSKILMSQTVLVNASIGRTGDTPMTFSEIKKNEIKSTYSVQDLPEVLSYLPSTTFYSEGGSGIGYNYLNIRGFDQRRISVSINGIPQNDPEDHNVYWVDFPDILQDAELIQVQRGSGSGIIGYPALGGSINIISSAHSNEKGIKLSSAFGSYNTQKINLSLSSGLIDNKYSFSARFSKFKSDGYRNLNWVDFKSFYVSTVRFDDNFTTQLNIYGAPIADGLTYTGLPKFAINDKKYRRKNYSYWEVDGNNFSYALERRKDEIENFYQPHYELLNDWQLNKDIKINSALFLVVGEGFFDYDGSWADTSYFRLTSENGFTATQNPGNALIRAVVKNRQWGWLPKISVHHKNGDLIFGAEIRAHNSVHYGNVNYAENLPGGTTKNYKYYEYSASKKIINFFAHENYSLNDNITLLAETQFSFIKYNLFREKYLNYDFTMNQFFFNPRIGLNYKSSDKLNYYFMFSSVAKEPRLKNYYDAAESSGGAVPQFEMDNAGNFDFNKPLVMPERMNNFELGLNYLTEKFSMNLNAYYMLFNDEIINQGQLDRFGQPITGNIDKSIHSGIELNLNYKTSENLEIVFNSTLSNNFISKGFYFIDKDNAIDLSGNKISGFPNLLLNGIVKLKFNSFNIQLANKYLGKYYSDNFDKYLSVYLKKNPGFVSYFDNQVESYFVSNLYLSYNFNANPVFANMKLYLQINNIWDSKYSAFAIGQEFFPNAERNIISGLEISL